MNVDPNRALQRVIDVAQLDKATIEEVEADTSSTLEAGLVVAATSVIGAIGTLITQSFGSYLALIIASVAGWYVWAWAISAIASRLYNVHTTDRGEMLRVIGYGSAPRILGIIPLLGIVSLLWTMVVLVVGIRQAGEMQLSEAIISAVLGMIPVLVVTAALL